ncbi:MAG: hypothetical protein QOK40_3401 [Miltoncostaeaceae bacterium]|nr:hypothetical protein [Miltoncostaeaceae bacterium]
MHEETAVDPPDNVSHRAHMQYRGLARSTLVRAEHLQVQAGKGCPLVVLPPAAARSGFDRPNPGSFSRVR